LNAPYHFIKPEVDPEVEKDTEDILFLKIKAPYLSKKQVNFPNEGSVSYLKNDHHSKTDSITFLKTDVVQIQIPYLSLK
jgi:hypothetical protein